MKKLLKALPLIIVLIYTVSLIITNFGNLNTLMIIGFTLALFFLLYAIFMITTEKYIVFKGGIKLKSFGELPGFDSTNKTSSKPFSIALNVFSFILLSIYIYYSVWLNIKLTYLLYIVIGLGASRFILKIVKQQQL